MGSRAWRCRPRRCRCAPRGASCPRRSSWAPGTRRRCSRRFWSSRGCSTSRTSTSSSKRSTPRRWRSKTSTSCHPPNISSYKPESSSETSRIWKHRERPRLPEPEAHRVYEQSYKVSFLSKVFFARIHLASFFAPGLKMRINDLQSTCDRQLEELALLRKDLRVSHTKASFRHSFKLSFHHSSI
ncbi:uncharacterized protein LOC112343325 [Selaginella moellendorffii]|uniref:uncharacterized protein LOC112343325 n=1 Tax=Selaginella moellendorffii TaxID=88036 RepID=UPI000D1CB228|nr:uncharacterized protein LOC112343325 [Selaginella moellendorffii]|eukprot:XP_024522342.1 uncharacterized protein LOC112343325 [Selaginella moellendorffii]